MLIGECFDLNQTCYNLKQFLVIIKFILKVLYWVVPLIIIVLGTIDLLKVVTSSGINDSKETTTATKTFFKRICFGLAIFIVPFVVELIFDLFQMALGNAAEDSSSWLTCWKEVDKRNTHFFDGCVDIYADDSDSSSELETRANERAVCQYEENGVMYHRSMTISECNQKNGLIIQ